MKNRILLLAFFLLFISTEHIFGQAYTLTPNDTMVQEIGCNDDLTSTIYFNNQLPGDLALEWQLICQDVPSCWEFSLCDYNQCFTVIPSSRDMDPIPTAVSGFLKLQTFIEDSGGHGLFRFRVNQKDSLGGDIVTFLLNACTTGPSCVNVETGTDCGAFGVNDNKVPTVEDVDINPNLVTGSFRLLTPESFLGSGYEIMDALGKSLSNGTITGPALNISMPDCKAGVYFVNIYTPKRILSKRIVKQ